MVNFIRTNKIGMYAVLQSMNDRSHQIEYFHQYGACLNICPGFKIFVESMLNSQDSTVSEIFRFKLEPNLP